MRVIYADDEADVREIVTLALEMDPAVTVESFADARSAIDAARDNPPDVVMFDLMMPGMDGYDAIAALRREPGGADMPVVFLTAKGADARERLMSAGAAGVLAKPFDPMTLAADLRALVGR